MDHLILRSRNTCPYLQKIAEYGSQCTRRASPGTPLGRWAYVQIPYIEGLVYEIFEPTFLQPAIRTLAQYPRQTIPVRLVFTRDEDYCVVDDFLVRLEGKRLMTLQFLTPTGV